MYYVMFYRNLTIQHHYTQNSLSILRSNLRACIFDHKKVICVKHCEGESNVRIWVLCSRNPINNVSKNYYKNLVVNETCSTRIFSKTIDAKVSSLKSIVYIWHFLYVVSHWSICHSNICIMLFFGDSSHLPLSIALNKVVSS